MFQKRCNDFDWVMASIFGECFIEHLRHLLALCRISKLLAACSADRGY
jgi:hypothetical protein